MSKLRKLNQQKEKEEVDEVEQQVQEGPKFLGMDYFRVIYGSAALLAVLMITIFFTVEDESMKRMTMVQGGLSIVLIMAMSWYHGRIEKRKMQRLARNKKR